MLWVNEKYGLKPLATKRRVLVLVDMGTKKVSCTFYRIMVQWIYWSSRPTRFSSSDSMPIDFRIFMSETIQAISFQGSKKMVPDKFARLRFYVKEVTPKCLGGPPVDRDRLNVHPGLIVLSVGTTTSLYRPVDSLVVRASDSRTEGLSSKPDVTKYPPSTHGVRAR
ncbi:hypothetical protein TNCV_2463891 [Trichonephila clavipes]|nr:hypothetical protein TNCV_2463891 [Trichonephila clavipes]